MKLLYLFSYLLAASMVPVLGQNIHYVVPEGAGDGSSWANAAGDLRAILLNAVSGDQVWVAAGTYYPTSCANCSQADRDLHFNIPAGVAVYGGFTGEETTLEARDWQIHATILHGDINHDNALTGNAYNVIYTHNADSNTLLDGFIITMGYADDATAPLGHHRNSGAGWFNDGALPGGASHPVIRHCAFIDNHSAGYAGALINDASFQGAANPLIENCLFNGNSSMQAGGAIANAGEFSGQCFPVFRQCLFTGNLTSGSGGAVYNIGAESGDCQPVFDQCDFNNNLSNDKGGAIYNFGKSGLCQPSLTQTHFNSNHALTGGAVYNDGTFDGLCHTIIEDCFFESNSASSDGGAMYNAAFEGAASPIILRTVFRYNHSGGAGAALFNNGDHGYSEPQISESVFYSNTADTYGGVMYNQGKNGHSSPLIENCLLYSNSANSAGAIYNLGAEGGHADATISNCTFYGNSANVGGAIYCNASDNGNSSPVITNCIFSGNVANFGSVFRCIYGTPFIQYSFVDVAQCEDLNSGTGSNVSCGGGMLYNLDPMFASPTFGDFHPSPLSPVVDAGFNGAVIHPYDLDGNPRISNAIVDMGAYEYIDPATFPQITAQPVGASICTGSGLWLSVEAITNGTPLQYQWYRDDMPITGASDPAFSIGTAQASDSGWYFCQITNEAGTIATDTVSVEVLPTVEALIEIDASSESICTGEVAIFSATIAYGGDNPAFQWWKNGAAAGADAPIYEDDALANGDSISCTLYSDAVCVEEPEVLSNAIGIAVNDLFTPFIGLQLNSAAWCEGEAILLTAMTEHGGAEPQIEWFVNGVSEAFGQEFISENLEDGDEVYCTLSSSLACITDPLVTSDPMVLDISPVMVPFVFITATDTSICAGDPVTLTATALNGGENPVFEWFLNGISTGITGTSYVTDELQDGDIVYCDLYASALCVTSEIVNSAGIQFEVCVAVDDPTSPVALQLFPNPASHQIALVLPEGTPYRALRLINAAGQYLKEKNIHSGENIIVLDGLPSGYYSVLLTGAGYVARSHFIKLN